MIETFRNLWNFSAKRHKSLIWALVLSFFRSAVTVSEFLAIIAAMQVLCGTCPISEGIFRIIVLAGICVMGNFITTYFEQINTMKSGFFMVADQRVKGGNTLKKIPLGFFQETASEKISAILTTTLSGVESAAAMVMVGIISGLFSSFCLFLFILFYDWRIGIPAGTGMAVYLILVNYQMKLSRKNAPALQSAQSGLVEAALTFIQGIKVAKVFSFHCCNRQIRQAIQKSCDENISLTRKSMPSQYAAGICIAVFESLILLGALLICLESGDDSIIKTLVLIIFSFMVYLSLNQAGSMLSMIGLLDSGLSETEEIQKIPLLQQQAPEEHPVSDEIILDDISFSYGENEVLHHVSARIAPQSLTAIIGPSGSGKTTLCQLIPRFRDVSSGRITIGGADIRNMPEEELMSRISMVFQNVYLFEDTVLNNIRIGKPGASLDEVRAAAKAACCDDFIMALPQGYDTVLQEGGCSLSGGEKQRISIARAMIKDSPIIILDEATSALDAENEHEILSAIDRLTKNKTVIMIAHRIKSVQKADLILAMKEGKIVQKGTHQQLKEVPGLYSDFLKTRQKASRWEIKA